MDIDINLPRPWMLARKMRAQRYVCCSFQGVAWYLRKRHHSVNYRLPMDLNVTKDGEVPVEFKKGYISL